MSGQHPNTQFARDCLAPAFKFACLMLVCMACLSSPPAASAAPQPSRAHAVFLENRTYTPLWFRTRASSGAWTNWTSLLPGYHVSYPGAKVVAEVSNPNGGAQQWTLSGGETYYYRRKTPRGAPELAIDPADKGRGLWTRPKPPQAAEFQTVRQISHRATDDVFQPLTHFVDQCEQRGDQYKLSILDFAVECYQAQQAGAIPEELRYVHGFTWFFGYVVDAKRNDVILLGVKDPTKPPLDLDCLATAIKAVETASTPACSLDDNPDPKYQKSIVRGVPWNTRWAEVMIDADYEMKKVGQGKSNPGIAGMRSWFDNNFEYSKQHFKTGKSHRENRWWFNFDGQTDRAVGSSSGDVVVLYRNPVRVSTEAKIQGAYGTGQVNPMAQLFADDFTRNIDTLGRRYPSVNELLSLYRLYDVFFHLHNAGHHSAPALKYWFDFYNPPYAGPPQTVPTLKREQSAKWSSGSTTYSLVSKVEGGVQMRLALSPETLQTTPPPQLLTQRIIAGQ